MANKEAVFSLRVDTGSSVQDIQRLDKELGKVNTETNNVQDQFDELRAGIKKTSELVDELSKSFGDNSQEADNARKELAKLTTAYDQLSQSATDANATFEDIYGELQPLTTRLGEAEDRLYELALAGDTTSQEYQDLLATVVKYRRAQIETDMVVDNAAKTFGEKLAGGIGTATELFSGFESVTALVGVESEDLTKTMVKLQAIQGLANAVQEIQNKLKEKDVLITGVQTVAQRVYAVAVGQSAGAMKAFRTALLATGIGAIIVALAAAAEALGLFGDSSEDAEKAQAKLDEQIKRTTDSLKDQQNFTNQLIESNKKDTARLVAQAKLRGDSEEEITKIKNEQSGLQRKLLANDVETQRKAYYKAVNDRKVTLDQLTEFETLYFGAKKKLQDFDSANEIKVLENAVKVQENAQQKRKEAAEKAAEASKKAAEDRKADLKTIQDAEKEYNRSILSDKEQEILAEQDKFNELIKLAQKHGYDTTNLRLALKNSLNDIEAKYAQQELDLADQINEAKRAKEIEERNRKEAEYRERIAAEEAFYDEYNAALLTQQQAEVQAVTDKYFNLIEQAKAYGLDTTQLETKLNEEVNEINKKYEQERFDQKLQFAQDTLTTISNLAQLFAGENEKQQRKAFQVQKAVGIAQATIDTYKSAQAAYASLAGVPVVGPALGAAAAAAAISAGLLNVKNIASQKFEGGGSTGSAPAAPSLSTGATAQQLGGNATNANLNTQQSGTAELIAQSNEGTPVYVLESDITGTQNKVAMQNKLSVW